MWTHPSNQNNISGLIEKGINIIDPASGALASGLEGKGRMPEPEELVKKLENYFTNLAPLKHIKALITAGPTYENIDPVRFIGNYSTGKMGYALCNALIALGAKVHLVSGPSSLAIPKGLASFTKVRSALEMLAACEELADGIDLGIFAAAVSDYRPKTTASKKLKKGIDVIDTIELVENPDILKTLSEAKKQGQYYIGFALETDNLIANAKAKRLKKGCDFIIANSPSTEGTGFAYDTNKVSIIGDNYQCDIPLMAKEDLAKEIITQLMPLLNYAK